MELEKAVKERDELKDKIAKWEESTKNLEEILKSQMSARDKTGLGYNTQLNELSSNHETDSENSLSTFNGRSSDDEHIPENDRFSKNGYKVVPLPITGNFLTPIAVYLLLGETARDSVIIEDWTSDDEEEVFGVQKVRSETRDNKSYQEAHVHLSRGLTTQTRPFDTKGDFKNKKFKLLGLKTPNSAGKRAVVNTGKGKLNTDLKKSRWVWRPKRNYLDHVAKKTVDHSCSRRLRQSRDLITGSCSGKQQKASSNAKLDRIIRKPLELLHMDLFGPVSVKSINKKRNGLLKLYWGKVFQDKPLKEEKRRRSQDYITALKDEKARVEAIQEELLQFKIQQSLRYLWIWPFERRQEEGIDYDEVFAPVARIEAIRLRAVCSSSSRPLLKPAYFTDKVYKVAFKALYGSTLKLLELGIMFAVCAVQVSSLPKSFRFTCVKRIFRVSQTWEEGSQTSMGLWQKGLVNTDRSNVSTARSISTVRPVYTVRPVSTARPLASKIAQSNSVIRPNHPRLDIVRPKASNSPIKRSYFTQPVYRPKDLKPDVKTFGIKNMTTVGTRAVVSKGKVENVLKKAKWVWRPKMNYQDHVYKYNGSYMLKKFEAIQRSCYRIMQWISMDLRMDRGNYYSSMVFHMANLKYSDKHNMVAFLKKPNESVGFTEVVDFLKGTSLRTLANGTQQLVASIDSKEYTITEASVRSKLQLADATGIHNLSDAEIYARLATLGYVTEGDIVPLLPAMLAGATVDQGEGSAQPAEPHHTPIDLIPSTSQPLLHSPPHLPLQSPPHSPLQSPPHLPL
ncbi:hypothetical protein Tco_0183558 [Tanacetum coccineum]